MSANPPDPYMIRFDTIDLTLAKILKVVAPVPGPSTPFTPGGDPTGAPVFIPDPPPVPVAVPPPAIGWWRPTVARTSFPALAAGDYAGAQEYAGNGYLPDGTLALAADKLEKARLQADALSRCNTADEANVLVAGASRPGVEEDAVIYAIMLGKVDTSGAQNPNYSYGFTTIAAWVDYLQHTPAASAGQGPGTGF
jgi:hypothetical protein